MKLGDLWNLKGRGRKARDAPSDSAGGSGITVDEWLNSVVPDENVEDAPRRTDLDDNSGRRPPSSRYDEDRRPPRRPDRSEGFRAESDESRQPASVRQARPMRGQAREAGRREAQQPGMDVGELNSRLDDLSQQLDRLARRHGVPQRRERGDQDFPLTGAPPMRPRQTRPAGKPAPRGANSVLIDQAVAEIMARQRTLDGDAMPAAAVGEAPTRAASTTLMPDVVTDTTFARHTAFDSVPARENSESAGDAPGAAADIATVYAAAADIAAVYAAAAEPQPDQLEPSIPSAQPIVNLSGLEQQLHHLTGRIEELRPSRELETAVAALRKDLAEIGQLITEALPRHAVESLGIEVKALADRIDHSRQHGVDGEALATLERGLNEVREALSALTPAEKLVGFNQAVQELTQKIDLIVARDDPATLQQLQSAIDVLRGITSHVASNETLTSVAEDIRALAARIDGLGTGAADGQHFTALEGRIDTLTDAIAAATEAGHAVPRELEKLLSGLIEKLEWVQLTHPDHAAMAQLEDRITGLVQRFDASDQRLGSLESVEKALANVLAHLEGGNIIQTVPRPLAAGDIERDVAAIKQTERRTQDSLEAVHDTVEHVVDRLAMIESDIRGVAVHPAVPAQADPGLHDTGIDQPQAFSELAAAATSADTAPPSLAPSIIEADPGRASASRTPLDPSLPPDHPLEPGSAVGRSRSRVSPADRIAASEAAVASAKPPVIDDPGGKSDFIAAARRAALAAAAPYDEPRKAKRNGAAKAAATTAAAGPKQQQRLRTIIFAGVAALIVIGCLHIASRWYEAGVSAPDAESPAAKAGPPLSIAPESNTPAPPASAASPHQDGPPAAAPAAPPTPTPSTSPGVKSGALTDPTPPTQTAANNDAAWFAATPAPEITGALPQSRAPQKAAPSPATAPNGEKLPAAIGGPALRSAAAAGDAAAAYEVAMRLAEGRGVPQNGEEAARWFERAAKQGLAPAQFRLGGMYEKGVGVKKDLATARDFYLAAAAKGNGKAMHNLAVLYAEGVDGPPDYRNAALWFRKAADRGIVDSEYNLAILYARGVGVEQNYAESFKWFSLASLQGDKDAAKKSEEVAAYLDQQALAEARLAVKAWTPEPQPDEAVNVKAPPGGWDGSASGAAPAVKPKPRTAAAKVPAPNKIAAAPDKSD